MKKFKDQSLSKAEMNLIHGGIVACNCGFRKPGKSWFMPANATVQEMDAAINTNCSSYGNCTIY